MLFRTEYLCCSFEQEARNRSNVLVVIMTAEHEEIWYIKNRKKEKIAFYVNLFRAAANYLHPKGSGGFYQDISPDGHTLS